MSCEQQDNPAAVKQLVESAKELLKTRLAGAASTSSAVRAGATAAPFEPANDDFKVSESNTGQAAGIINSDDPCTKLNTNMKASMP